jgi:dienelactone hydrolase
VGGFGPIDGVGAFVHVDFTAGTIRFDPREDRAPLGLVHPHAERGPHGRVKVRFTAYEGRHRWTFDLHETQSDVLQGTVSDPKQDPAIVRLFKAQALDRRAVDESLAGTYAVGGDAQKLLFVEHGRLFDTRDGSERRLFLLSGGRALIGDGFGTAHPFGGIARTDSGGLRIEHETGPPLVASSILVKKEEIRFVSDGVTLQGTLTSPPGPGPFPTVVFVHGSGHSSRRDPWENAMARVFMSEGYAMFLYDKRGVGDSGGEYVGRGGRVTNNVSQENIEQLARDARAAAAAIAARKDVDPNRFGFFGLSQAGWIVPSAARGNKAVRFIVMISSPTVPTAVQLAYQALNGDAVSCLSLAEAGRVARDHAPRTGSDPAPAIASLDIPGLWIYGSSDPLAPFAESMAILDAMKKRNFTLKLAPRAGHELFLVDHDTEDERQLSPGISPVAIETLRAWLHEQASGHTRSTQHPPH